MKLDIPKTVSDMFDNWSESDVRGVITKLRLNDIINLTDAIKNEDKEEILNILTGTK